MDNLVTLLELYQKKNYNRELRYLLNNCENDIMCSLITESLAFQRINCKQLCLQNKCHLCDTEVELYTKLKEKLKLND